MTGAYYTPLCWLGVLMGVLLLLVWVISPYLEWRESQQAHIQQSLQKAGKLQALQLSVKQWQTASEQTKAVFAEQMPGFFNAASYIQAQQELFNLVNDELKRNQLRLMTHSFAESAEVSIGEKITVQLNIQGGLADIIHFIDTFSNHQKLLSFPSMHIIKNSQNAILQVTIVGYRLKATSPEPVL
ncbi:MAG: hypothetical protein ABL925_01250 [Methylococcales bacterium]